MKKNLLVLVVCLSFALHAEIITVRKMVSDPAMDRSFFLKTNLVDEVTLDCQSFIQGLRIGKEENTRSYVLDPYECEELYWNIERSMSESRNHCIDVEWDIRSDYSCD